jgi:hypothetical protein
MTTFKEFKDYLAQSHREQMERSQAYDDAWKIKDPVQGAVDPAIRQAAWELINLEHHEAHAQEWTNITCDCVENPMSAAEHDIVIAQGYKPIYSTDF